MVITEELFGIGGDLFDDGGVFPAIGDGSVLFGEGTRSIYEGGVVRDGVEGVVGHLVGGGFGGEG